MRNAGDAAATGFSFSIYSFVESDPGTIVAFNSDTSPAGGPFVMEQAVGMAAAGTVDHAELKFSVVTGQCIDFDDVEVDGRSVAQSWLASLVAPSVASASAAASFSAGRPPSGSDKQFPLLH